MAEQHYDRFFLEWDSDTSGDIKALEALKDSKAEVVLGLLSSKTTDLDDEERVLDLLEKASQILPKERLFLSTNVVSPHVTQGMSWQHLNNGLKSNKVKKLLRNSLAN